MNKALKHSSGTIEFTKAGNAFLISDSKKVNKDIYIPRGKTGKALNGDIVFVKLTPKKDAPGEYTGEVEGVTKRFRTEFVGVLEHIVSKDFYVVKSFAKKMPVEFYIPKENLGTAVNGDKVVIKLSRWNTNQKKPTGVVKQVFGKAGDHSTEMNSILFENNIDSKFPSAVLAEAEQITFDIPEEEIAKREDFRGIVTVCVDPIEAKDKDDCLSIRELQDGNYEIGIHIADITHYVRPGSELFKEAYRRGNSCYLVDRVIHMFPKRLSSDVCSLNPNEDKLCFSAIFQINKEGEILSEWFGRTIINIDKDYSYEEAQEVIEKGARNEFLETDEAILMLDKYAKILREKRIDKSISFEKNEIKFTLDLDGTPIGVYFKVQKDSNKLIEEFMLLANKQVAKFLKAKKVPSINRIHEKPSQEKLESLASFVSTFGHKIDISNENKIKSILNKLLIDTKGKPEENVISTLVIRSQQKAVYSTEDIGHFGLGFEDYAHFTSPIRRMADVLTHIQLSTALGNGGYLTK